MHPILDLTKILVHETMVPLLLVIICNCDSITNQNHIKLSHEI